MCLPDLNEVYLVIKVCLGACQVLQSRHFLQVHEQLAFIRASWQVEHLLARHMHHQR